MDSSAKQAREGSDFSRFEELSSRLDHLLERVMQLIEGVAHVTVQQQAVLTQVEKTNGTVALHEARLKVLEGFQNAHPLTCPMHESLGSMQAAAEKMATKRGVWYAQGKAVWGVVLILLGALAGALIRKFVP